MCATSRQSPTTPATSPAPKAAAPRQAIRIESPAQLISIVPYLLGFHPGQDVIIIGTAQPRHLVRVTLRYSLDPGAVTDQVRHALALLSAQQYDTAVAVGYGPDELVTPFMDWLHPEAEEQGITFTALLRVDTRQQRYWSYLCEHPVSGLPEGTPYEPNPDAAVSVALAVGVAGVLASRETLADSITMATDEEAESMVRATRTAKRRIARFISQAATSGTQSAGHHVAQAGIRAMREAIQTYRQGGTIGHTEAAWLTVSLRDLWVRDDACARMDPAYRSAHLRLWTDLTRVARPGYVPAPATLLAYVAWQSGNGALANVALHRALTADPHYPLAAIVRRVLDLGRPPSDPGPLLTPEEVAAAYANGCRLPVAGERR